VAEISGEFTITGMGAEDDLGEASGLRVTHAHGDQQFTGGIEGTGRVDWLMCYRPDRTASFVGIQRIDGTIDGRPGAIVLQSVGRHDGQRSEGRWTVIDGSATGCFDDLAGEGSWSAGPGPTGRWRFGAASEATGGSENG
jgi:hypothetical protein